MNILEEKIEELIIDFGKIYKGNDWLVVKKYILKYLNPKFRSSFSKRDDKTKKHIINSFEKHIIKVYEKKFNIRLVLKDEKKLRKA